MEESYLLPVSLAASQYLNGAYKMGMVFLSRAVGVEQGVMVLSYCTQFKHTLLLVGA